MAAIFLLLVAWLAITAPLSRSLQPSAPPSLTLVAADGSTIVRRGPAIGAPVDAKTLPKHVTEAFVAIEDRRFYSHPGIDPIGISRALWHNLRAGGVREGASTITQQLAKNAFLSSDRTIGRKFREVLIAFWLEAWLSKDQILSRYLSNVYFGDNVYGLTAAAQHYFGRAPRDLTIGEAAMLAGMVKAPSRLSPTTNLAGAQAREAVVVDAMVSAKDLTADEARLVRPERILPPEEGATPTGTYFTDWVLSQARDAADGDGRNVVIRTTLDPAMQRDAKHAISAANLGSAQAALVAMRPDGRVVAMVGGRDYAASPFNRVTQARRQPGSAFKLFVYLAAMRAGMTPDSPIADEPVDIKGWRPDNADGRYEGEIPLTRAFARSSNVAAARLIEQVGVRPVVAAARDFGITTPIPNSPTIALGTAEVSLLELTAAYAGIARGRYPVHPRGLAAPPDAAFLASLEGRSDALPPKVRGEMLTLLAASVRGTGRAAALSIPAWGKTGTSQSGRDAWFVGFAGGLVVGVWVGNDDNRPDPHSHGGGVPALIWRDFMVDALHVAPAAAIEPADFDDPEAIGGGRNDDRATRHRGGRRPFFRIQRRIRRFLGLF